MTTLATFTGSDWYQLAATPFWTFVGLALGYWLPSRSTSVYIGARPVSLAQVVQVQTYTPSAPAGQGHPAPRSRSHEWNPAAVGIVVAVIVWAGAAWAYIERRDVILGAAVAFICLALGVVLGIIVRRVDLGLFVGGWKVMTSCIVILGAAILVAAYFVLHPLVVPPNFSVLLEAYRKSGWSAIHILKDRNSRLFGLEGLGAASLVLASAFLLWVSVGLLVKSTIVAGVARDTWIRRFLARPARTGGALASSLFSVVIFLGIGFVCGAGYAAKWSGLTKPSILDVPQLLVPAATVSGRVVTIEGVASANGSLSVTLHWPRHRDVTRTARIMSGKTQITEVARPKAAPALITLVPISPTGTSGDAIRFVCRHNVIACTRPKVAAAGVPDIKPQFP